MKTDLLSRLSKVKQTGRDSWIACCPAHEDRSPSMTIRIVDDGRVLLHCFAGCPPLAVLEAVGLDFSALFPEPLEHAKPLRKPIAAADVLEGLMHEATILLLIANEMKGGSLSRPSRQRMLQAIERIEQARRLANG
jgi:hypothetical protein